MRILCYLCYEAGEMDKTMDLRRTCADFLTEYEVIL